VSKEPIYVVMVEDRHADLDAELFTDPEQAIAYARRTAHELCRHPESYEEETIEGWLFYARYSTEGDSVWVVEKTLDGAI